MLVLTLRRRCCKMGASPMPTGRIAFVVCMAACAALAQDLAPDVLLLSRIRNHLKDEFTNLPNYTCLETISRFHKPAGHTPFRPLDTVRLEISYSNHHEWYASPGDRKFTVSNPASLAGGPGLISDGLFAITLHNLFIADGVMFTSRGEESVDGHRRFRFDYRFPAGTKLANVSLPGGVGWVNEEGSIWTDPESLDLVRMDGQVTEIPPYLPLGVMEFSVTFARTRVGESDSLLSQDAGLRMSHMDGYEDYDRIAFTHCRMFQASSTLRFDVEPGETAPVAVSQLVLHTEPADTVPALLKVIIEVTSSISSKDAVGKLIEGRVVGDVLRKGQVVLVNGAPVRGRIRRLDRYVEADHFVVGLEFIEVMAHGAPLRFYADLVSMDRRKGIQPVLREVVSVPNRESEYREIKLPELPGVASFFVDGKSFVLAPGLRTVWRTRGLLRGVD